MASCWTSSRRAPRGTLTDVQDGKLAGSVACKGGGALVSLEGDAVNRTLTLTIGDERTVADKQRELRATCSARCSSSSRSSCSSRASRGAAMVRIGQPRVMGEVLAGIALGPTLLGRIDPGLQAALFPIDFNPVCRRRPRTSA